MQPYSEWEEEAEASVEKRPQRRDYELTPEGLGLLHKARERVRGLALGLGIGYVT